MRLVYLYAKSGRMRDWLMTNLAIMSPSAKPWQAYYGFLSYISKMISEPYFMTLQSPIG